MVENKFGFKLPLRMDSALMALVFYSIGYLMRDIIKSQSLFKEKRLTFLIFIAAFSVIVVLPYLFIGQTYLSGALYGPDLFCYLFTAVCGSFFLIILGSYFNRSTALAYIGRNSLVIFTLHSFAIYAFDSIIEHYGINNGYITSVVETLLVLLTMIGVSFLFHSLKQCIFHKNSP